MKTDERYAIDKRVKEMSEKREDSFFFLSTCVVEFLSA
jgi:hypothetical protein